MLTEVSFPRPTICYFTLHVPRDVTSSRRRRKWGELVMLLWWWWWWCGLQTIQCHGGVFVRKFGDADAGESGVDQDEGRRRVIGYSVWLKWLSRDTKQCQLQLKHARKDRWLYDGMTTLPPVLRICGKELCYTNCLQPQRHKQHKQYQKHNEHINNAWVLPLWSHTVSTKYNQMCDCVIFGLFWYRTAKRVFRFRYNRHITGAPAFLYDESAGTGKKHCLISR